MVLPAEPDEQALSANAVTSARGTPSRDSFLRDIWSSLVGRRRCDAVVSVLRKRRGRLHVLFGAVRRSDRTFLASVLDAAPGDGLRHAGEVVIDGVEIPDDGGDASDHVGELLLLISRRDRSAFAQLYDMLSARVFGLILRVLVDRAQSEEVLQEVFLEIWQSADRFVPNKGRGRTWILTMAHRRAVDRVRSAQTSADRDLRVGFRDIGVGHDGVAEEVELRIEAERVAQALSTLPEAQREAITLAYFGGYSQSEVAALVGAPLGTVKTRMRDGLSRLRTEMGVTS